MKIAAFQRMRSRGWPVLAVALLLSACGDRAATPSTTAAAQIEAGTSCALDGMLLADYPGPKAQVFYEGVSEPEFFCDTLELLSSLLMPEQVRKVRVAYVQDMGQTDWDKPEGHWTDARQAWYVHGSQRKGSMGPTLASFSQESAAREFVTRYGGKVYRFTEITPEMVDLAGGRQHDVRM